MKLCAILVAVVTVATCEDARPIRPRTTQGEIPVNRSHRHVRELKAPCEGHIHNKESRAQLIPADVTKKRSHHRGHHHKATRKGQFCDDTGDCAAGLEYCSHINCMRMGTCKIDDDCYNEENYFSSADCLGYFECQNSKCSQTCEPTGDSVGDWKYVRTRWLCKQVALGTDADTVWHINAEDQTFFGNGDTLPFTETMVGLMQVSVCGKSALGVAKNNTIWYTGKHKPKDPNEWQQIEGALMQVAVSLDCHHVWGVASNRTILYKEGGHHKLWNKQGVSHEWKQIEGKLKQVSVSAKGKSVWGVASDHTIWHRHGVSRGSWHRVDGSLKQIAVSGDGKHVWGVASNHTIWYRHGVPGPWYRVDGSLMQIAVSGDGKHVWGVHSTGKLYSSGGNPIPKVARKKGSSG